MTNYADVFDSIRDFLSNNHPSESAQIVARFVCSCYWGERMGYLFDLKSLDSLDAINLDLCTALLHYRRSPKWSDDSFHALAMYAKAYI